MMTINRTHITRIYNELQSGESGMAHLRAVYDHFFYSYAWPGGYPMAYIDDRCNWYCPDCAKKVYIMEGIELTADIYWEGPTVHCEECNCEIESAYGEVD